ncbi:MAG TPA: hypothetical protein VF211_00425 [Burkholderiales bacterium]
MRPERRAPLALAALALLAPAAHAGVDIDGLALGLSERAVLRRLPSAHCQPLQWKSLAADRRCDDSRARVAGLEVRITVYLKSDAVEAFDVRFDSRDAERMAQLASERFGAKPVAKAGEKVRTLRWQGHGERGLLSTQPGERRASLLVWRGDFYEEIYRVR